MIRKRVQNSDREGNGRETGSRSPMGNLTHAVWGLKRYKIITVA